MTKIFSQVLGQDDKAWIKWGSCTELYWFSSTTSGSRHKYVAAPMRSRHQLMCRRDLESSKLLKHQPTDGSGYGRGQVYQERTSAASWSCSSHQWVKHFWYWMWSSGDRKFIPSEQTERREDVRKDIKGKPPNTQNHGHRLEHGQEGHASHYLLVLPKGKYGLAVWLHHHASVCQCPLLCLWNKEASCGHLWSGSVWIVGNQLRW